MAVGFVPFGLLKQLRQILAAAATLDMIQLSVSSTLELETMTSHLFPVSLWPPWNTAAMIDAL